MQQLDCEKVTTMILQKVIATISQQQYENVATTMLQKKLLRRHRVKVAIATLPYCDVAVTSQKGHRCNLAMWPVIW